MRLICPNCNAQYEVAEGAIPETGRDVQCSGCGHAWFQRPIVPEPVEEVTMEDLMEGPLAEPEPEPAAPAVEPDPEVAALAEADEDDLPVSEGPVAEEAAAPAAEEDGSVAATVTEFLAQTAALAAGPGAAADTSAEAAEPAGGEGLTRRRLDDEVLGILREEAERETQARQAEGSSLETQPDLGLGGAAAAGAEAARARSARLRGSAPDEAGEGEPEPAHRRDLFPDIDQINSTLRPASDREGEPAAVDDPELPRRRRSGFRVGFIATLAAALALLGAYVFAPSLGARFPALEPTLAAYTASVDRGRIRLDQAMQSAVRAMRPDEPAEGGS